LGSSRTVNSIRNIIWAVINKVAITLLPFAIRSVMIYKLGTEYTGLSGLFTSILTVLSLAELGFSNAMVYCMYEPIHKHDNETICALLKLYRKIYRIIGFVILIAGLLVVPFLPNLIHGTVPQGIRLTTLYLIYLANSALSYFMFAYKSSLLAAHQRNDIISIIELVCRISLYVLQMAVLLVTANFYAFASLLVISTVCINFGYEIASKKLFPGITCRGVVSSELKAKIKKRVIGIMLYKFSSSTRSSFNSIVISGFLGLTLLTQYQNYYLVVSSVLGILTMASASVTASVGDSIVAKDVKSNYADFKKFVFIYMWVGGWFAICIGCLIQPFMHMKMWMGGALLLPWSMALLFAAYFYVQTMGEMVFLYRTAAGLWWQDRIRPVVEVFANITLNLFLVRVWGIHGAILATILTLVGINFLWGANILFKNYFSCSMKEYVISQAKNILLTAIVAAITLSVCELLPNSGVIPFIGKIVICAVVPNVGFYLLYRKEYIFQDAKLFIIGLSKHILNDRLVSKNS